MSGVRFVSIVFAIAASFLWGGFVVNSWQKNSSIRSAGLDDSTKNDNPVTSAREMALHRADELALAASNEYEKLSKDLPTPPDQLPSASALLKAAELAKMAEVVGPKKVAVDDSAKTNEKSAINDTKVAVWTVPTGADPVNDPVKVSSVNEKISTIATKVKDEATGAVESVGSKISSLAEKVKDNLSGDGDKVADASAEGSKLSKTETGANKKLAWRVPDANSPDYNMDEIVAARGTIKVEARISDDVKPGDEQPALIEKKREAIAEVSHKIMNDVVDERLLLASNEEKQKGDARLGVLGNDHVINVNGEHDVTRDNKDDARLSKDLKSVRVAKYKSGIKDAATPTYDEEKVVRVVPYPNTVWKVPTGATPEYNMGVQIERGFDSVAEVAAEAGAGIVDKVVAISDNVKGAIASPPKWVVPTGVTPGGDEADKTIDVAVKADEVAKTENVVKSDEGAMKAEPVKGKQDVAVLDKGSNNPAIAEGIALPEKMKFTNNDKSASAKDGEELREVVVSANMEDFNKVEVSSENGTAKERNDKNAEKIEGKAVGLVNRIINMLTDVKGAAEPKDGNEELYQSSRVDKVRFEAIKNLMVDGVDYKFTNLKKGEGQLVVNGRAQPEALLSLYLGPRYLGDVVADKSGTWVYTKELYIPRNKHIIQAQQMSDGGVSLARKSYQFAQDIAAKPPKDYKPGVGIDLGDKALATLRKKLKKDTGKSDDMSDEKSVNDEPNVVDAPLPVLKGEEIALADTKLMQKEQAALAKKMKAEAEAKVAAKAKVETDAEAKLKAKAAMVAEAQADKAKKKSEQQVAMLEKSKLELDAKAKLSKDVSTEKSGKVADVVAAETGAEAKYYIVKAGDSLGKIAKLALGSAAKYKELLRLNPQLKNANLIYPSQKLLIAKSGVGGDVKVAALSKKDVLKAKSIEPEKKTEDKKALAKIADEGSSTYIVKRGDSLWTIAKKVYGNGADFKKLIKLNPQLAKNPGAISPNMKLQVNS